MDNLVHKWAEVSEHLTAENAKHYASTIDKQAFCSDTTALSVDSRMIIRFENELEKLAIELGYLQPN